MNSSEPNKFVYFLGNNFYGVIIFAVLAVLSFGYFFFILPSGNASESENTAYLASLRSDYLAKEKTLQKLNELNTEYVNMDKMTLEKVHKMIPDNAGEEDLMRQMETIVMQNGFLLTNIQLSAGKSSRSDLKEEDIDFAVSGVDYAGFKRLLGVLENNLRIMDVTKLSFDPVAQKASFYVKTYFK